MTGTEGDDDGDDAGVDAKVAPEADADAEAGPGVDPEVDVPTAAIAGGDRDSLTANVSDSDDDGGGDGEDNGGGGSVLLAAYRHDVHKLRGRRHDAAAAEFAGVAVNERVPEGADGDAAFLSRPRGDPEVTVQNHVSSRRLSLLTGSPAGRVASLSAAAVESATRELVQIDDAVAAHEAWLESSGAALVNESAYYPYTSLKYHVLLTAALLSNYRDCAGFADLYLVVDAPGSVVPHRTVLSSGPVSLRVTHEPGDCPAARLGDAPARCFADVWSRLPEHPLATSGNRRAMMLDAQLRRIRSWSAGLQFIEDYASTVEPLGGSVR